MKLIIYKFILLICLIACSRGESIEKHLGNIYYYSDKRESGGKIEYHTNYYYIQKDGKSIKPIGLNYSGEITLFNYGEMSQYIYLYDSNNTYVFEFSAETELFDRRNQSLIFKNNTLIFTKSFYDSKPIKTYKLLNKKHEYYSIAEDYEKKLVNIYGEAYTYNPSNFINGKEPYQKRRNDILNPVKHSYKEFENDFKDYYIYNSVSLSDGDFDLDEKFAILNEDYKEILIACEIKDINSIVPRLCNPTSYDYFEGRPDEKKRVISMNFDKKYAYIRFQKIDKQKLLSVGECPVCGKSDYEVELFIYNPYMRQYECKDCYGDYMIDKRETVY